MSDKLIRAIAKDGEIRIIAATTTNMINEAVQIHNCAPTAAAAFGRMLTAGSLMGAMLKSSTDSLTLTMAGDGPTRNIVVTTHADANVKGYISNPSADLPLNEKGKLDVGAAVGKEGFLTVIKDFGLREPYIGKVPIYTGEIGDDIAYYFTVSEQTPSAVGLGVLVNPDSTIKAAGGFIIQMMPGFDELTADLLTYRLEETPSITHLINEGQSIEEIISYIFEDMDLKIIDDNIVPEFKCDCSHEKVEAALISIGKKDLEEIYNDGKEEEIKCNFCHKAYKFTNEDIGVLLQSL